MFFVLDSDVNVSSDNRAASLPSLFSRLQADPALRRMALS